MEIVPDLGENPLLQGGFFLYPNRQSMSYSLISGGLGGILALLFVLRVAILLIKGDDMSKTVIGKDEKPQTSVTNFFFGTVIDPIFGFILSQTDMPTQRDRIYTLRFSDGSCLVVGVATFNRYRVGDEYP